MLRLILRQAEEVHVTLSRRILARRGGDRMGLFPPPSIRRALAPPRKGLRSKRPFTCRADAASQERGLRAAEAGSSAPKAMAHPGKCEDVSLPRRRSL